MLRFIFARMGFLGGVLLVLSSCGPGKDVNLDVTLYEDRVAQAGTSQENTSLGADGIYTVVNGDTLYGIGKRFNVPLRLLISENRLSPPYNITVGSKIRIPQKPVYVVKSGDTLYKIARKFHLSTRDLVLYNDIKAPYVIVVGEKIDLPIGVNTQGGGEVRLAQTRADAKPYGGRATTSRVSESAKPLVATAPLSKDGFVWPVRGTLVKKFGFERKGVFNAGINVQVPNGTPVIAAENGVVVYSGSGLRSLGNLVLLKHHDGYVSAYGHLAEIKLTKGSTVKRGEVIGNVGKTGQVKIPQLHFQLRHKKKAIDPLTRLKS